MSIGVAVLVVFWTARLSRLVVLDKITDALLLATVNSLGRLTKVQAWFMWLVTCNWCTSLWIGPLCAAMGYYWGERAWFVIGGMGCLSSYVYSVSAQWIDPGRREWAP